MTRLPRKRNRLLFALLAGRFEPMEAVLGFSAVAHASWLLFPYWETLSSGSISGGPRIFEVTIAILLGLAGMAHLVGLAGGGEFKRLRRNAAFCKFIMWCFFTVLAIMASGISSVVWFPYATITCVSALVYLSISVGVPNGIE